jgi:Glycosyltransferase family 87
MRHPSAPVVSDKSLRTSWLTRPLSGMWCAIGWLGATATFIGLTALLGGPTEGDAGESLYSTWAIAHGRFACSFPPATHHHFVSYAQPGPFVAPLYPLLSGAVGAVTRIGHAVSFPSATALGPHCSTSSLAIYHWAANSGAALPTVRLGYLSWIVLMAGVVALVRACGRGRCGWEPVALVLLACTPPVFQPLLNYFHPQDLVAMGLGLGGVACARRSWWVWAGILLGLALTSQQFAILIVAPLLVIVPGNRRTRFVSGVIGGFAIVVLPAIVVTSGRAMRAAILGSGNSPGTGGSWLWELHLHGAPLLILSRILPIVLSLALSRWAVRRLGSVILEPVPLLALVATSLSLRLAFEQNLYGYYFMALAVSLVVLDVIRGHIRGPLIAWIALLTLAYNPVPWGFASNGQPWGLQAREDLPLALVAIGLIVLVRDAINGRIRWYLVGWLAVVVGVFLNWPPWVVSPFRHPLPSWAWQLMLVPLGALLAAWPLVSYVRGPDRVAATETEESLPSLVASK